MGGRTTLKLTDKDKSYLKKITRKRSGEAREVSRAKILLHKADGLTIDEIASLMKIHRNTVILCLKKYSEGGIDAALNDKPRKSTGRGHGITPEGRDWVISIASREPQYAGLLDSSWSYEGLTSYISKNAAKAGFPELESISKTSVRRILSSADNETLKIRRNDMSQHRHDGDVQLSIPIDDFLAPVPDWQSHGPGEQLSMSMLFDSFAIDSEAEPDEPPVDDYADDPAETLMDDDLDFEESLTDEDIDVSKESFPAAESVEEPIEEPASDEDAEEMPTEENSAEPVEDAPETEPVEDIVEPAEE